MLTRSPVEQHAYVGPFGRTYLGLDCTLMSTTATTNPRESKAIIHR